MINTIGEAAGQVYQVLDKSGESTIAKLKTATKMNDFILAAAVGWLARENKVKINQSGKSVKVSLV
ncbi:MAG: winged helix-turn-helix domain-containing protein [Calditrichaceae bacterium]|nr:winged helix-turn-helix domain-containing protein [Calditrichaceae bacterium]